MDDVGVGERERFGEIGPRDHFDGCARHAFARKRWNIGTSPSAMSPSPRFQK